jgi:hypothetical protein
MRGGRLFGLLARVPLAVIGLEATMAFGEVDGLTENDCRIRRTADGRNRAESNPVLEGSV